MECQSATYRAQNTGACYHRLEPLRNGPMSVSFTGYPWILDVWVDSSLFPSRMFSLLLYTFFMSIKWSLTGEPSIFQYFSPFSIVKSLQMVHVCSVCVSLALRVHHQPAALAVVVSSDYVVALFINVTVGKQFVGNLPVCLFRTALSTSSCVRLLSNNWWKGLVSMTKSFAMHFLMLVCLTSYNPCDVISDYSATGS